MENRKYRVACPSHLSTVVLTQVGNEVRERGGTQGLVKAGNLPSKNHV